MVAQKQEALEALDDQEGAEVEDARAKIAQQITNLKALACESAALKEQSQERGEGAPSQ